MCVVCIYVTHIHMHAHIFVLHMSMYLSIIYIYHTCMHTYTYTYTYVRTYIQTYTIGVEAGLSKGLKYEQQSCISAICFEPVARACFGPGYGRPVAGTGPGSRGPRVFFVNSPLGVLLASRI